MSFGSDWMSLASHVYAGSGDFTGFFWCRKRVISIQIPLGVWGFLLSLMSRAHVGSDSVLAIFDVVDAPSPCKFQWGLPLRDFSLSLASRVHADNDSGGGLGGLHRCCSPLCLQIRNVHSMGVW